MVDHADADPAKRIGSTRENFIVVMLKRFGQLRLLIVQNVRTEVCWHVG